MPFLKEKIKSKQQALARHTESDSSLNSKAQSFSETNDSVGTPSSSGKEEVLLPQRKRRQKPTCPKGPSKNIVKNYGKQLCSFSSSLIAVPYIESVIEKNLFQHIKIAAFQEFIKEKKEGINSIDSLRKLLVPEQEDSDELKAFKTIFKQVSIIFLKYFSVNWIYGGKLTHKNSHLQFRFKMLRRVQNAEHFTYLKASAK